MAVDAPAVVPTAAPVVSAKAPSVATHAAQQQGHAGDAKGAPVAAPAAAPDAGKGGDKKGRAGAQQHGLSMKDLSGDSVMRMAKQTWLAESGEPYSQELVRRIWAAELGGGSRPPPAQRASVLEVSQYLEKYLWPHAEAGAGCAEHTLSIMAMVNEKMREGLSGWAALASDAERFSAFVRRAIELRSLREPTLAERTLALLFFINLFQSLENEVVRKVALPLVSLPIWHALSPGRLQLELAHNAQLEKHWRALQRKEAKAAKAGGGEASAAAKAAAFLPGLVDDFLQLLQQDCGPAADQGALSERGLPYCERFVEFLIDMLSQLPTRRFLRTLLDDRAVLVKARLCAAFVHPRGRLFSQLVDLFAFYQFFEINDHTGMPLSDDEMAAAHSERLQQLQRLAFAHVPKLRELALSNCGALEKRAVLLRHLSPLEDDELRTLSSTYLRLLAPQDPWAAAGAAAGGRTLLLEVLATAFEKRRSQRAALAALPLYPTEEVLWDENLVPSLNYSGEGALALPKLNLQFLTFHDYLLRNFNLFRLEATYDIREDLGDVLRRVGPRPSPDGSSVVFSGWARMALPFASFAIVEVRKPNVGDTKPAGVTAEIKYDTSVLRGPVREEWDGLKQHDVLFLLGFSAQEAAAPRGGAQPSLAEAAGLRFVRGCEVVELRDGEGKLMNDFSGRSKRDGGGDGRPKGTERTLVVALDTAQYQIDITRQVERAGPDVYGGLHMLVRRKPKENNFKAILECIRDLMQEDAHVPTWLHDIFLGYGDPAAAHWRNLPEAGRLPSVDFKDTFLDAAHLRDSFPGYRVEFTNVAAGQEPAPPFRVHMPLVADGKGLADSALGKRKEAGADVAAPPGELPVLRCEAYVPPDPGPYPEDQPQLNRIRFTPVQVEAVLSGVQPGLTMIVGPPGTGKTDTAVQILHTLYHNCPGQRTLVITHSNAALNDLFQKIMGRDVPARYMLRLGMGEEALETDLDFSRMGRVNAMLTRRLELLTEVERLAQTLGVPDDVAYTCETASHFWLLHVLSRWEVFQAAVQEAAGSDPSLVAARFPFLAYFANAPGRLFEGVDAVADMRRARGCFRHLKTMFTELEECRAFELLKGQGDRSNYLFTKQAKIVAMTCTHAALKRREFCRLGFKFDNLLMEESAQILEVETFIPMILQRTEDERNRLKRVILIGDHHQLPPVVKNVAFQKYCRMDQSLFTRFVRLGTPYIELNAQGRARPSMAALYNWRYRALGDLPSVSAGKYAIANTGFAHEFQFVDVGDYDGMGEMEPTPHFTQNLGEAEYIVSVFQYMRLLGYPASKISIITTYRGQKHLIRDVVARRCAGHPLFGVPAKVTTVDKFQGQQNDYVLLSLVRTRIVGHLRDVRRLVVAMSRARLGLYVFGRRELFEQCYEMQPTLQHLFRYPSKLALVPTETHPTMRGAGDKVAPYFVEDLLAMGALCNQLTLRWQRNAAKGGDLASEPLQLQEAEAMHETAA